MRRPFATPAAPRKIRTARRRSAGNGFLAATGDPDAAPSKFPSMLVEAAAVVTTTPPAPQAAAPAPSAPSFTPLVPMQGRHASHRLKVSSGVTTDMLLEALSGLTVAAKPAPATPQPAVSAPQAQAPTPVAPPTPAPIPVASPVTASSYVPLPTSAPAPAAPATAAPATVAPQSRPVPKEWHSTKFFGSLRVYLDRDGDVIMADAFALR